MRTARLLIIPSIAISILAACAPTISVAPATVTAYTLAAAPSSIGVAVPTSLVKPAGAKTLASRAPGGISGGGGFFTDEGRGAYHWVKETMWQTEKRLARAAATMVLVDSVIGSNKLALGTAASPTAQAAIKAHVWTAAEMAAFEKLIPASFINNAAFKTESKLPAAGDTVNIPAFSYSTVDPADTVNSAYNVMIVITADSTEDNYVESKSFYWTSAKDKFKFAAQKSDSSTTPATVIAQDFAAYDGTTLTMASGHSDNRGSMSLVVAADPTATATNGVIITFNTSINATTSGEDDGDATMLNAIFTFTASGYADSAGGFLKETFVLTPATGTATTYYFKEGFDASGKLTLAQVSTDATFAAASLTTISAVSTDTTAGDKYKDKEGTVTSKEQELESSDVKNEVQKEEKHHVGDMKGSGIGFEFTLAAGIAAPKVADAWTVSDSATDFTATHMLGTVVVTEVSAGTKGTKVHVRVTFSAKPSQTIKSVYLAPLVKGVADITTSPVVTIALDR